MDRGTQLLTKFHEKSNSNCAPPAPRCRAMLAPSAPGPVPRALNHSYQRARVRAYTSATYKTEPAGATKLRTRTVTPGTAAGCIYTGEIKMLPSAILLLVAVCSLLEIGAGQYV